jgi:hypothetical protein
MSELGNGMEEGAVLTDPPYIVQEVAGRPPTGLDDLVGATTLTVTRGGEQYRLVGAGLREDDIVLFHQRDIGSATEDFLVWSIADAGDGNLVARPPLIG